MANSFTDPSKFYFANPANAQQQQFNQTIGLGGQNNVNKAYTNFLMGPGSDPNASLQLEKAWGTQFDDPSTNPDVLHNILGTYTQGGNNLLGAGYAPIQTSQRDILAQTRGVAPSYAGTPLSQIYGNGYGAAGATSNPAPVGAPAGTTAMPSTGGGTAALPGVGSNTYSNPLTDVSAYLDPSMQFTMQQGMNALQNSAAASGNLLSGQTLKDITNYSQGLAGTNWQNAYQNALADTNRRYGVDANDRAFNYTAQTGDRDFNNANAQFLASLGMQGTNAQSQLAQSLATLLSGNSVAAGQAQGAGTIGANNALGSSLSQIISQLYGNNILSQLGLGGGTNG